MRKDLSKFQDLNVPFTERREGDTKTACYYSGLHFCGTDDHPSNDKTVRDKSPQHLKCCFLFTLKCTFPKGTWNAFASTVGGKRYGLDCSGLEYGYMDIWIYGYMDIWIYGYTDIRIYGYTDIWIYGYMDIRIYGYMDIRIYGYTDIWIYGYMDIWIYGYMDIWIYGYMDIRIYGYTDIWIYGYMDLRVSRKAEQFPEQLSDC